MTARGCWTWFLTRTLDKTRSGPAVRLRLACCAVLFLCFILLFCVDLSCNKTACSRLLLCFIERQQVRAIASRRSCVGFLPTFKFGFLLANTRNTARR